MSLCFTYNHETQVIISTEYIKDSSNTGSESHHLEEQSNEITKIGPNVMFCNIQGLYNQTDLTKPNLS